MAQDQCVFVRGFRVKDDKMQVIRVSSVPENTDIVDPIRPPIKNENPQRSPYRHPTLQRSDDSCNASCTTFLGDDPLIVGSSSSLDTIGPPIDHENLQPLPYSSSTDLQSNGGSCNASFLTSPSYISSIVVQNYTAEIHHEAAFAEDTKSTTHDNDLWLPLVESVESLTISAEDSLRESNTSLLNRNSPTILRDPQKQTK
ncbi:hypothetical protein BGY98DRAFT_735745 [Russula aff. rugulosa BPL654]|nr:hypothetical protein BGY98DRAFT_735745 [Russula aff. rugulosa BPL654]